MKRIIITTYLVLIALQQCLAQCTYVPPVGTVPIQQHDTLLNNANINPFPNFIVCQNVELTLTPMGTQIITVYLEPYAHLTINHDSLFYAEIYVYAKEHSVIDFGVPNQINVTYIHDLVYDSTATIIDSAGSLGNNGIIQACPSYVGFSYSNFLGGTSPCVLNPNAVNTVTKELNFQLANPFQNEIIIINKIPDSKPLFKLYNTAGQMLLESKLKQTTTHFDASKLPHGLFYYQIVEQGKLLQSGKLLHSTF